MNSKSYRAPKGAAIKTIGLAGMMSSVLIIAACNDSAIPVLPDEANERVSITNNPDTLNTRISYADEALVVESYTPAALRLPGTIAAQETVALRLISEITPPMVDGQRVQATAVTVARNQTAVISYNMRGAPRLGAVDWVNWWRPGRPYLTSGIIYNDSDINAVNADNEFVYTAVATNATDFPFPAVIERMKIRHRSTTLTDNARAALGSFAATSVLPVDDVVYATSGNEGGLYAFDAQDFSLLGEFPLHDARWVAVDKDNNRLVVAQGTPGMLSVFEEGVFTGGTMNLLNAYSFPGANIAESKSTVEIAGGKAFIAAGTEGVQIMCLDDGSIIGSVPRPSPAMLGLDPAVVVTNAVAVDDDLMFIANGEAGVYVARGSRSFKNNDCEPQQITVLGRLRVGNLQSANHVAYKARYLYIAAGLGGVKVIRVNGVRSGF